MSLEKENTHLLNLFKGLVEVFDSKSGKTALFVALVLIILWQNNTINELQRFRLEDSERRRNSEVEIYRKLVDRFDPEMKKMRQTVDSSKSKIDSTVGNLDPLLQEISSALESKK